MDTPPPRIPPPPHPPIKVGSERPWWDNRHTDIKENTMKNNNMLWVLFSDWLSPDLKNIRMKK